MKLPLKFLYIAYCIRIEGTADIDLVEDGVTIVQTELVLHRVTSHTSAHVRVRIIHASKA